jgi:sensor histidine kinase regulating citrate/malate metabolism
MNAAYQDALLAAAEEILLLVDPSLLILAANPAAARLLGYPADALWACPSPTSSAPSPTCSSGRKCGPAAPSRNR